MQAGDAIVKVADGPERLTIAQVDALLYLPNKSRVLLERALRVPALSEGWQESFRSLLARTDGGGAPAWAGFRPLRVAEVRPESATITSFRLIPTDDLAQSPRAAAGQYLTVRDVSVGFGCRNGVCHNCESGLLAGEVSYGPEPLEPPPDGRILVCCSRPTTALTLDL